MKVPFNDLYAQYLTIKSDIDNAISSVIRESAYIKGGHVKKFEDEFARFIGKKFCVGCANGTDTLEISLRALGVGAGDEVIVPAYTWISTSEAVTTVGAKVVFVDVHPEYYTIDPTKIAEKITKRTKAIIPVHFYGLPAEMDEILDIANSHGLKIIEDCAQSHLATYKGKITGTMGDVGSFSFFPGKNLGAYGDAGGIVTDSEEIALYSQKMGNHGRIGKYDHEFEGRNSRLDGLHAAILSAKLPYLKEWTNKRQSVARLYTELLTGVGIQLPEIPDYSTHVFHLYVIQVENRDKLQKHLSSLNIETGIHYPVALPFSKAYSYLGHKRSEFPVADRMMSRILSLPIFPEMTGEQVQYVTDAIKGCING